MKTRLSCLRTLGLPSAPCHSDQAVYGRVPTVVTPCLNKAQAVHRAGLFYVGFARHVPKRIAALSLATIARQTKTSKDAHAHRGTPQPNRRHLERLLVRRHLQSPGGDGANYLPAVHPPPGRNPHPGRRPRPRPEAPDGEPRLPDGQRR
ncbi:exported hypothetical protein [Thiomonas arsenitoxydans]|nr:exported hypothetical protein [Thiomonas arsenitoxydans]